MSARLANTAGGGGGASLASTVGRALTSVGLVLFVTGAVIGMAFFGARSWLTLVPVGAGALALLLGLVLGARSLERARVRLLVEVAAVAVVVFFVNALAVRSGAFLDVTAAARNTLAESSVAVARSLAVPVVVEAALAADERAYADLELLIARYRVHSDRITLRRSEPSGGMAALEEARVTLTTTVGGDERRQRVRFVAGSPEQEQQFTNALRAVSAVQRPRAYVLAGHGEPSIADEGPAGLRRFGQALADEGLELVSLPLHALERVPEDAALVIVAAPSLALPEAAGTSAPAPVELERLQRYLDGGGRLLLLLEPRTGPVDVTGAAWAGLLGSVGVQAGGDVVSDGSAFAGLLGGPETATGVAYAAHPATSRLGGSMTHFPRARSLAENPIPDVVITALVQTGAEAFGETTPGPASLDDGDVRGPMTLAMAAERAGPSATRGDAGDAGEMGPGSQAGPRARAAARVVVVGDSTFASNSAIGLGANADFAVHVSLWLADREDQIAVRARGRGGNLLLLSPTSRERIAFVLLYGMPVLLLGSGLTIRAIRRRR